MATALNLTFADIDYYFRPLERAFVGSAVLLDDAIRHLKEPISLRDRDLNDVQLKGTPRVLTTRGSPQCREECEERDVYEDGTIPGHAARRISSSPPHRLHHQDVSH